MQAAVYQGNGKIVVDRIPTPVIGPGELLIRVESCGICHTDLKKVQYDLLPAPRVYGHETAGQVVAIGEGVTQFQPGDRVIAFHHIPCKACFYCQRRLYAQCPVYKKVGITAGYEPAGGGFAQYVRVMDWIVERGVEKIPDGVSYDQACFVEPVNTCLKAVEMAQIQSGELVAVLGQGPIGLIFTMLLRRKGATVLTTDTIAARRELSQRLGALESYDPREVELSQQTKALTAGRGADAVFIAVSAPGIVEQAIQASRPGSRILLFAQTSPKERIELAGADICMGERLLFGAYSADIDLQAESARLVFGGELPLERLVSHRVALDEISRGFDLALHPDAKSLKIIVHPQRTTT
ncbi:MAG: alcohol dehydrogenase catalytic domain-containing protein [Bryobacteraceae bacterium]|nr:alcohol dehydrogenase catalytic domain-containing protein [Bryobacteraceae bacterium]MDW8377045.1 alcohol dehydrogenase catalytic domain-containing protein [Bryobacterales bacterium]